MKKMIAALLAILLLSTTVLTGCGNSAGKPALELNGSTIGENVYHYWVSTYKGQFINQYSDVENTEEFWAAELVDGMSAAEYFDEAILENVKYTLVSNMLFEKYGLTIDASEKSSIQDLIQDYLEEYAEGNKNFLNAMLGEYGVNMKLLEKIYIDDVKISKVYNYLYGENGVQPLSDEDKETYYQDNYVHFQMIFINNAYQYVQDSSGNYVTDNNGYYQTENLDASTKAEKDALVTKVKEGLDAGEDFNSLYETYSELKAYDNGYFFSAASIGGDQIYYDLLLRALELETGETAQVDGDYGVCFIQKLDLDEGAWNNSDNNDFFNGYEDIVGDEVFRNLLREHFDDIQINDELVNTYSIATVTPNYSFYY